MSDAKPFDWRAWIFPKRDHLPSDLTTADWLKTLAVILMLVDHVGYYLFPEIDWFRVIGRPGMPIWFFLVGYARRQDLDRRWLVGGIILVVANLLVGMQPMPLNALFSLLACRLIVPPLWHFLVRHQVYFWWIIMLLMFVGPITNILFFEYGAFGILFAAIGYAMRRRDETSGQFASDPVPAMFIAVMAVFVVYEIVTFAFSPLAGLATAAGFLGIYLVLNDFSIRPLPNTANHPHAPLVRFMGRYTLEIYVIHLLILKAVIGLQLLAKTIL